MIESDGGRADEANPASFEQFFIAMRAGTYNQRVGVSYYIGCNVFSRQVDDLVGQSFQCFPDVGYLVVNNNFHSGEMIFRDANIVFFYNGLLLC